MLKNFEQFTKIIKDFYSDLIILKVYPIADNRYHFMALLDKSYIQDDRTRFFLKFGTVSSTKWTLLAQIASVPEAENALDSSTQQVTQSSENRSTDFSEIVTNLMEGFRSLLVKTGITITVKYPVISITPLAIYRI